ncbi:MAG: TIGR00730 family Rossman fold protein [Defluviicoccus sp.]|nr:TIGR00730 family Rossman fold protein [Defluviicoccus sp.]MDG4591066.1 TIGR00730 family Rossman fold protein [Defluviicoccus sp.]MDS4012663.1 TIGR00730 family Rossman fold protein [Defluviicoccus sp.]MDS4071734.1 TIGR00730 family Rossman fold protein [Defluviicoccus sp.]
MDTITSTRSLCVFCGSREGSDPAYREAAIRLGVLMARRGVRLIYGGGSIGLMGVVADAVLAEGGEAVGVIPDFLMRSEHGHRRLTEQIITGSMHDRKRRMFELADAFCVMPGGLGTLDETFEILTWKQIRLHELPIIVLDIAGYWQPLQAMLAKVISAGFADASILDLVTVANSPDDVLDTIATAPSVKEGVVTSHL